MIWLTSDLHLGHDREFVWGNRGFDSLKAMEEYIVANWNAQVKEDDDVYILGDVMLGPDAHALYYLYQLNGKFHLIRGNHDTDRRIEIFSDKTLLNNPFVEICDAKYLKYGKYHFYMTHYPCLTGNLEKEALTQMTLNLHGHTHASQSFFYDLPYCYNVGMDAHQCLPISIDKVIEDMKNKVEECKSYL